MSQVHTRHETITLVDGRTFCLTCGTVIKD